MAALPFRPRTARFDWQALHGCDPRHLTPEVLERLVDTLLDGDLTLERPLSPASYTHLARLLQAALQYAQHLRLGLAAGAEYVRWRAAEAAQLAAVLQECCCRGEEVMQSEGIALAGQRQGLQQLAHQAEQLAAAYNSNAAGAQERPRRWQQLPATRPIDWLAVHSIDVERGLYQCQAALPQLCGLLPMLATGWLPGREEEGACGAGGAGGAELQPPNYVQLVQLLQCGLDLALAETVAAEADKGSAERQREAADRDVCAALARWQHLRAQLAAAEQRWQLAAETSPAHGGICPASGVGAVPAQTNGAAVLATSAQGGSWCPGCAHQAPGAAAAPLPPLFAPAACCSPLVAPVQLRQQSASQAPAPWAVHGAGRCSPILGSASLASNPGGGVGAAAQQRQFTDAVEDALSKERRRGLEMGAALSQLWGLVGQLRSQSAAPTAAPQQPLRPPAASGRRGTGSDGDEDTQVEVDVGGVLAAVRRQAEAQLRFTVQELKQQALEDVQARHPLRGCTPQDRTQGHGSCRSPSPGGWRGRPAPPHEE